VDKSLFQIRATGVLIENGHILLVKQDTSGREWSLPGGRAEAGELLEQSVIRELFEETGLAVEVEKLLYVCDKPDSVPPILHMTFLLSRISGDIQLPTNEFDSNPISDVQFVPVSDLGQYGFSKRFMDLVENGFPNSGSYMGLKENIGL
jgi:ADP-ribose pyrophosphatase YjhB (NUDIX family)